MKKVLVFMMALLLVLGLAACSGSSTAQPTDTQTAEISAQPADAASEAATSDAATSEAATPALQITQEQLDKVTSIINELTPLYNEALTAAEANGWMEDETANQEFITLQAIIVSATESIEDPTMFDGVTDMEGYIEQLQLMVDAMPDLLAKVSEPYAG